MNKNNAQGDFRMKINMIEKITEKQAKENMKPSLENIYYTIRHATFFSSTGVTYTHEIWVKFILLNKDYLLSLGFEVIEYRKSVKIRWHEEWEE